MATDKYGFELGYVPGVDVPPKREKKQPRGILLYRRPQPVTRISDGQFYRSIRHAAEENNVTPGAIRQAIKRKCRAAGSYWEYYNG